MEWGLSIFEKKYELRSFSRVKIPGTPSYSSAKQNALHRINKRCSIKKRSGRGDKSSNHCNRLYHVEYIGNAGKNKK
jgi:hypothetical protein